MHLLAMATIVIALGAGAAAKSYTSAGLFAVPRQALPIRQTASTAHSATMPILVPAEAVDPTAEFFVRTAERTNGSWTRP
jgi:hypothetical protein